MAQKVTPHSTLLVHMIIKLSDGSVAENTRRYARPSKIILGNHSVSEAFARELLDLVVGDKKTFHLAAKDAFGESLEENFMQFPRSQFSAMENDPDLEVGGMVEFDNAKGETLIGVIKNVTGAEVMIDFNHPLAGQDLEFEIEVLSIEDGNS